MNFHYKIVTGLQEQLDEAVAEGLVLEQYESYKKKLTSESKGAYVERSKKHFATYQFVKVVKESEISHVAFGTSGPIKTKFGKFELIPASIVGGRWGIHNILVFPSLEAVLSEEETLLRLDSGCVSGPILGDTTCDCHEQMKESQRQCVSNGSGIIMNALGHDGRGWGDLKMLNQRLMDELDYDTVRAAEVIYGKDGIDQRDYAEAGIILHALGFKDNHAFLLATQNKGKAQGMIDAKFQVSGLKGVKAEGVSIEAQKNIDAKNDRWYGKSSILK